MRRLLALATTLVIILGAPLAARAQGAPSYASVAYNGDSQIRGRITSFDGGYQLGVRDENGYLDNVRLHQGTIINPTGLTLAPGMTVSILGYNAGSYFAANEVDTPYTYYNSVPYYSGHPWNYYGPSISLSFFFGNPGWWHGTSFYGPYRFYNGVRVYNNVHVNAFYHGGTYNGRNYVAPQSRGGYTGGSYNNGGYHGGYSSGGNGGGYHGGNGGGPH